MKKMSLRTRLVLVAGFAIFALIIASFVAWRLARATETFALRQADVAVNAAARDLARELRAHPEGYVTIDQASLEPPDKGRDTGPRGDSRRRPAPPHVESIFAAVSDPFARLSAITLHRYPKVAGGFYRSDTRQIVGYAVPGEQDANTNSEVPSDLSHVISAAAAESMKAEQPIARTIQLGNDRVIIVAYPPLEDEMATAWAMERVSQISGVADWPNLLALIALALSIIAVSGLALLTVKDLRSGVSSIQTGLAGLTSDLSRELPSPETAELAQITRSINELAANLRENIARQTKLERDLRQSERLSALGRVVAGVAHEVRNPLAAIKLKVQLIRRSSYPPEKLTKTIDIVCAEIERLDSLVRRLLELGGQQRLEFAVVDLSELISSRAELFNDLAARRKVQIVNNAGASDVLVNADSNRLAQVVDNIIQNALDAMSDGGQLMIACDRHDDEGGTSWARLKFDDTGPGIPPADREHIFEPFHTSRATGTGLGLAIARAIVEEHGGRLTFISEVGHGTSFVIELPLGSSIDKMMSSEAEIKGTQ